MPARRNGGAASGGKRSLSATMLRSSISNGRYLLSADIDQRGPQVRRLKDLIGDHLSDLGGSDHVSHSERILVHRAAMLTLLTEMEEVRFVKAKLKVAPSDLEKYGRVVNHLRRVLMTLGLSRRNRPTLSLDQYLDLKAERSEPDDDAELT